MNLRKYRSSDCPEMARLFYDTVHSVNRKDYTEEQLNAWADGNVDMEAWDRSFLEHETIVAVDGENIIGFGDMDENGYLDRLYVHRDYQGQGVATGICGCLEQWMQNKWKQERKAQNQDRITGAVTQHSGACRFSVHASITARPFFEARGYKAVREQQVQRKGLKLINYVMIKTASCPDTHSDIR